MQRVMPRVRFSSEAARQQAIREFVEGSYVAEPGVAAALVCQAPECWSYAAAEEAAAEYGLRQLVCSCTVAAAAQLDSCLVDRQHLEGLEGADMGWHGYEEPMGVPAIAAAQQQLAQWAWSKVEWASQQLVGQQELREQQQLGGQLSLELVAASFFPAAQQGLVVVELFGGMCAGLEACLRNGFPIRRYVYVDRDPAVQAIAAHRVAGLLAKYPGQLQHAAVQEMFSFWPQDVTVLQQQHIQQLARLGGQVMVWAGWECQDLSPAGSGRGLEGQHSSTFYSLRQVLVWMQQQLPLPPAWVLENTYMQAPWQRSAVVLHDFHTVVVGTLGPPLVLDAARFGSRAHRLRDFWTNLAGVNQLDAVQRGISRAPGLTVQQILDPGRVSSAVTETPLPPFYPCNLPGHERAALPTLVATRGSYAFRPGGAGAIWDSRRGCWDEPNPQERELALGYTAGVTAAPGASLQLRHQVTGRCMDANSVMVLLALSTALWQHSVGAAAATGGVLGVSDDVAAAAAAVAGLSVSSSSSSKSTSREDSGGTLFYREFLGLQAAAAAAQVQEQGVREIWDDTAAMQYLRTGEYPVSRSRQERSRINHRAHMYLWKEEQLWRRMPDGSLKCVPKPQDRQQLIQRLHEQTGHFGVKRTAHLVLAGHWWRTLHSDVAEQLSKCKVCDRVRSSFNSLQPTLQPLPVEPMFYRWGMDLCGEFPVTARGNRYVLVAVEHFSKHVELIAIPDKHAVSTAAAATEVLCRFAAPAEILTDGGGEWEGEFDELLSSCFIDHRLTSPNHPQANGLSERIVQVVKKGLRKMCSSKHTTQWDLQLPWIALGYRCSKQASTGFSPYELLYARPPVFPSAVQGEMQQPINFDDADAAWCSIQRRAKLLEERMPVAAQNLKAAQHRDTLRYQQLRSGQYLPRVQQYKPGDFVYMQRAKQGSSLAIRARSEILRVKQVKPSGVLLLQGKCGREATYHSSQVAPCHLPGIDGTLDLALQGEDQDAECEGCGLKDDEANFMFCEGCNQGWHCYCCVPPLARVPVGDFICPRCRAAGVTSEQLAESRRQYAEQEQQQVQEPVLFPVAEQRRRDERAAELHGRLLVKKTPAGQLWGRVQYKGPLSRPKYFLVEYADGSSEDGLTFHKVTKGVNYTLQPEGTRPPVHLRVPAVKAVPVQ